MVIISMTKLTICSVYPERLGSAWASAQTDQNIYFPHDKVMCPLLSIVYS